jgi:transposase
LIERILAHIDFLEGSILLVQQDIQARLKPYEGAAELLESIPVLKEAAIATILSEIGVDMERFPSDKHLASWAGVVRCITRLSIPGAAGKNSQGYSWINSLPRVERQPAIPGYDASRVQAAHSASHQKNG